MYGVAAVKFKTPEGEEKTLGWLDENGMQPAGNAPTFMDVNAAQVTDGPVDSIMTNPGSDAFTMNLIAWMPKAWSMYSVERKKRMILILLRLSL